MSQVNQMKDLLDQPQLINNTRLRTFQVLKAAPIVLAQIRMLREIQEVDQGQLHRQEDQEAVHVHGK